MDKKKNKLVLCELLICILVVCIIFILKKQLLLFETNDDQTMIDIVSGNFGISSFYMIYSNFLYGYLLKFLYMIFNDKTGEWKWNKPLNIKYWFPIPKLTK